MVGLSLSVRTEDEQKIAFGNFEEPFKREARCLSLKKLSPAKLRDQRYEKFRAIGEFAEQQECNTGDAQ